MHGRRKGYKKGKGGTCQELIERWGDVEIDWSRELRKQHRERKSLGAQEMVRKDCICL